VGGHPVRPTLPAPIAVLAATLLAVLVGACSPQTPEEELAEAFERTLDSSFVYDASLEGEGEAEEQGELGAILRGIGASGTRDGDAWSVEVSVLGFDVFELRSETPELRHLRLGIAEVLGMIGGPGADPSAAIVEELEARGHDEDTLEIAREALQGGWVTVEGPLDAEDLDRAIGVDEQAADRPDTAAALEALGGDLRGFVDEYVVVDDVEDVGDRRVFDVHVEVRDAMSALSQLGAEPPEDADLEDLPERVPGAVTVEDGLVREVVLSFGEGGEDGSRTRLRVEVTGHGDAPAIAAPDEAHRTDSERFLVALEALTEVITEVGSPIPLP
jgi:hypothetical protein